MQPTNRWLNEVVEARLIIIRRSGRRRVQNTHTHINHQINLHFVLWRVVSGKVWMTPIGYRTLNRTGRRDVTIIVFDTAGRVSSTRRATSPIIRSGTANLEVRTIAISRPFYFFVGYYEIKRVTTRLKFA